MREMSYRTLGLLLIVCQIAAADDWTNWRGPRGNGTAEGDGYPLEWSLDQNILWQVTLPGPGASTPAVLGNQIFLTAEHEGKNTLICLDRDGRELWRRHAGEVRDGKHRKATGCNSSPTTEGTCIVAYFKSGDLACFELSGEPLWHRNLQDEFGADTLWWDLGTSPVIVDDLVIIVCQQTGPSYVAAFDLSTGALRWKQPRILSAPKEANQSYTTPCVAEIGDQRLLIVLGADHITSHQLSDGAEVWRVGEMNLDQNAFFRSISSPVMAGDLVIAPYARGTTLTAVQLGGRGDVTSSHIAWRLEGSSADVPTPAFADGKLFVCTDKGEAICLDAVTGEGLWRERLPRSRTAFSSSPILADGNLYLTREDCVTFVLDASTGELRATNELDGLTVATPVFVDGRILIRTVKQLFCLGS